MSILITCSHIYMKESIFCNPFAKMFSTPVILHSKGHLLDRIKHTPIKISPHYRYRVKNNITDTGYKTQ